MASAEDCSEVPIDCSSGDGEIGEVEPSLPEETESKADVVFVIDGSTSIGEKSFILGKNYIADLVGDFSISPEQSRVAAITFGTNVTVNLELAESGDLGLDETVSKIKGIQLPGGGTKTGQGVKAMTELFQSQGRLGQEGIKDLGIILTDGRSQEPPGEYAKAARDLGIEMYAIGIGEEINKDELLSIAGSEERVFLLANFEALTDLKFMLLPKKAAAATKPKASGPKCVQLDCMLDDEGVPTMRVFVPNALKSCCSGRIGSCDKIDFTDSSRTGFVQRDVKAGECNTKFNVAEEDLEYTNVLNLFELSDNEMVVRDETEWRLKCTFPRTQLQTVMYDTNRRVLNVTNAGLIPMKLEIFDCAYEEVMPSPAIFGLKERVCVQASMPTHDELEIFPLKCWTTHGESPDGEIRKDLIVNGCDVEGTLNREKDNSPVKSRFSFEAFRFMDVGSCKVYVHCDLLICAANDPGSRCAQGCVNRMKRSLGGSYISSQSVTVGPIIIGDVQKDESKLMIHGTRMQRLTAVGQKLNMMMMNLRRGFGNRPQPGIVHV